jgi:hypothetical protein
MKALVTGATGLIGAELVRALGGARVLSRSPAAAERALGPGTEALPWDTGRELPAGALDGVDVVVHLAGESVADGRWSAERKARILESRALGTRAVVAAIRRAERRPRVLVSASAVGYYGSRGDELLDEGSAPGDGFLADVCRLWEREAMAAAELGVRVVTPRLGVVLAPRGGALGKMLPAFRAGVGGPLGSGAQWMAWVHLDDAVGLLARAVEDEALSGPVNVCAPEPARQRDFARALGRALHRPAVIPTPAIALKLAFGEMSEVLLGSQRAVPRAALAAGHVFRHADLDAALADLVGRRSAA